MNKIKNIKSKQKYLTLICILLVLMGIIFKIYLPSEKDVNSGNEIESNGTSNGSEDENSLDEEEIVNWNGDLIAFQEENKSTLNYILNVLSDINSGYSEKLTATMQSISIEKHLIEIMNEQGQNIEYHQQIFNEYYSEVNIEVEAIINVLTNVQREISSSIKILTNGLDKDIISEMEVEFSNITNEIEKINNDDLSIQEKLQSIVNVSKNIENFRDILIRNSKSVLFLENSLTEIFNIIDVANNKKIELINNMIKEISYNLKSSNNNSSEVMSKIEVSQIVEKLLDEGYVRGAAMADDTIAKERYGLNLDDIENYSIAETQMSPGPGLIMVVKAKEGKVEAVKEQVQNHLDAAIGNAFYPEEKELAEKAKVEVNGDIVSLFILHDEIMADAKNYYFKMINN